MSDGVLVFSIYSREQCHLCEEMLGALQKWQNRFNFKIQMIDIDQDTALTARFAARIPLLAVGNIELCEYHLDEQALLNFFENER